MQNAKIFPFTQCLKITQKVSFSENCVLNSNETSFGNIQTLCVRWQLKKNNWMKIISKCFSFRGHTFFCLVIALSLLYVVTNHILVTNNLTVGDLMRKWCNLEILLNHKVVSKLNYKKCIDWKKIFLCSRKSPQVFHIIFFTLDCYMVQFFFEKALIKIR